MPRHLLALLSLLAVLALGVVASGCGADDVDPAAVAEAADATREEGSARVRYEMEMTGLGLPQKATITGEGVTALDSAVMDLTFDFTPLVEMFGGQGSGETRMLTEGGEVYIDPPALEGLELPGGKSWIAVELAPIVEAAGMDPEALGTFMTVTPGESLRAIKAAGKLEKAGEEEVDGVATTRYTGEVRPSDVIEALPADEREQAREALDELMAQTDQKDEASPVELWLDEEDRIRRIRQSAKIPASPGSPAGSMRFDMTYGDFGVALDVQPPDEGETWDATGLAVEGVREGTP